MSMVRWGRRIAAVGGLALLMSCGGGTEQIEPFDPGRYFVFGDEMSVLTPEGRKYAPNAIASDGVGINCAASSSSQPSQLWIQVLANAFRFGFEQCNPNNREKLGYIYARPQARAADFAAQLAEARLVHGRFGCNDLVSILVGANDVIDLYETQYLADPTTGTANRIANELSERGARLGRAIAALTANDGANAIVSTIPLMNLTPYARQQANERPDINVRNVLNQFSNAFNTALRTNIPNDGSQWGLVELDALVNAADNNPGNYNLDNVSQGVCRAELPFCDNVEADLVPGGNPDTWLWANDRLIGWRAHSRLGSFARDRAQGNPFGCS
jgi:hypothetical protein